MFFVINMPVATEYRLPVPRQSGSKTGAEVRMTDSVQPRSLPWPGLRLIALQIVQALCLADQIRSERRLLASLDDRALQDIGIDRASALHESARGYFDLPAHRLRDKY